MRPIQGGNVMSKDEEKSVWDRLDDCFEEREKLDKEYWEASDKLTDKYEALMKEANEEIEELKKQS
jgi:hypothetical protein